MYSLCVCTLVWISKGIMRSRLRRYSMYVGHPTDNVQIESLKSIKRENAFKCINTVVLYQFRSCCTNTQQHAGTIYSIFVGSHNMICVTRHY